MENFVVKLNSKYKNFLQNEGKWLGGGFENVFTTNDKNENMLKLEVFSMLPQEIKKEILEYIDNRS